MRTPVPPYFRSHSLCSTVRGDGSSPSPPPLTLVLRVSAVPERQSWVCQQTEHCYELYVTFFETSLNEDLDRETKRSILGTSLFHLHLQCLPVLLWYPVIKKLSSNIKATIRVMSNFYTVFQACQNMSFYCMLSQLGERATFSSRICSLSSTAAKGCFSIWTLLTIFPPLFYLLELLENLWNFICGNKKSVFITETTALQCLADPIRCCKSLVKNLTFCNPWMFIH